MNTYFLKYVSTYVSPQMCFQDPKVYDHFHFTPNASSKFVLCSLFLSKACRLYSFT